MAGFDLNLSDISDVVDGDLAERERAEAVIEIAVAIAVPAGTAARCLGSGLLTNR